MVRAVPDGFIVRYGRAAASALALVVCLAAIAQAAAAAVTCRAEVSRSTVARGEDVVLIVTAQGDIGWSPAFQLPDLPGVRVYGGGTNQSMTVVNGQTQVSVSRTYYLRAENEGDFTIGPVRINTAAGACQTTPIQVKVVAGGAPPADTGNRVQRGATARPAAGVEDVFVTLGVDKQQAWVGQQVVLSFRYWRRVQPWSSPSYTPPRTEGFWREDLGTERNFREVHRGQAYNVTEVRYALFPTRAGRLRIEPAELSFPEDLFDRFFNSRQQSPGPRVLRTQAVDVEVRELPMPKPSGFSGIVATRCALEGSVDRTSVPRGEAAELKFTLETDGFLKGFAGLRLAEPEGTRLHDAAENVATAPREDRLVGRLVAEKVLVTTREGVVRVPPVEVIWFDAARGQYRTATTQAREVTATPSDRPLAGGEDSGFLRNEIARLGDDLAFIHAGPVRRASGLPGAGSATWWSLALAPAALLGVGHWWFSRRAAGLSDRAGRRRRAALAAARKRLREAELSAEAEPGLALVARALTGYVADCLDLPVGAVGTPDIVSLGTARRCPDAARELALLLERCDQARFGGQASGGVAELAAESLRSLEQLERGAEGTTRSVRGPVAGALGLLLVASLCAPAGVSAADVDGLMATGNQAYAEGRFGEARDAYLAARALAPLAADVHYNLGNAHARSGAVGPAVASYLRAQRLSPRDGDVRRNLGWLRQNLKDLELADRSLPLFVAQAAAVVGALSLDEWGMALVAGLWLTAAVMGWGWWRGRSGLHRRVLIASVAVTVLAGAVTAGRWHFERVREQAVVTAASVAVRSGPAASYPTLFEVHAGLALDVQETRDGWCRVSLGGDWQGWLPAQSVETIRLPAAEAAGSQTAGR
ncbi:MAG: BatD family protein [bacterium]|nr:BatD family protein [bacterium]